MQTEELKALVRDALVKHSRLKLMAVRDEDHLARDLGFDSFALLQAVLDLEDRLKVEIEPSELAGLRDMTFRELVRLIEVQLDRPAAAVPREGGSG